MLKVVFLQLGATLVAAAIAAVFFDLSGAVTATIAGLACVAPTALFAIRLALVSQRTGSASVAGFFVGEFVKVATIVGLLVLAFKLYDDFHWGGMFVGLVLVLKANLFAFLVKT